MYSNIVIPQIPLLYTSSFRSGFTAMVYSYKDACEFTGASNLFDLINGNWNEIATLDLRYRFNPVSRLSKQTLTTLK